MRYIFTLFLFSILILSGCEKATSVVEDEPVDTVQFKSFPLAEGNEWQYTSKLYIGDGSVYEENSSTDNVYLRVIGPVYEIQNNDSNTFFAVQTNLYGVTHTIHQTNKSDGLYLDLYSIEYAFDTEEPVQARYIQHNLKKNLFFSFDKNILNSVSENNYLPSVIGGGVNRRLSKQFHYPLVVGSEWEQDMMHGPNLLSRVISAEVVEVPAGKFHAYKVQTFFYNEEGEICSDITFFEYVSSIGIVKSIIEVKGIPITEVIDNRFEQVGTHDAKQVVELNSYTLNEYLLTQSF